MLETFYVIGAISLWRGHMLAKPADEEVTIPFTPISTTAKSAAAYSKYLVTANIKIVNLLWTIISPMITEYENRQTTFDVKRNNTSKMFLVKCVVYYYPFFYIAFLKQYMEGCGSLTGCSDELVQQLAVFFVTHIAFVIAGIIVPIILTRFAIRSEIKKIEAKGVFKPYSYLEAQAKCSAYGGDTDDFMELILGLGYVTMFSVAMPVMAFLAVLANLLEARLLAYRMVYVFQRTAPEPQEGIGEWKNIMTQIAYGSVVINVGLAIFLLHPLVDYATEQKLAMFIVIEHLFLLLVKVVDNAVPEKTLANEMIEETNGEIYNVIVGDENKPVSASPSVAPALPMTAK